MKWLIIRNPKAGGGAAVNQWPKFRQALLDAQIDFTDWRTEKANHAEELARTAIAKGYRKILALGGDGTVNEIVNGMVGQSYADSSQLILAQWPMGTGNDWSRSLNIPSDLNTFIQLMKAEKTVLHDVGLMSWTNDRRQQDQRYFINIASLGFAAEVVKTVQAKKRKGKLAYLQAAIKVLRNYKAEPIKLSIDGKAAIEFELFNLSLGIGRYHGGGMQQCPDAHFDDGVFDLTLIQKISPWKVVLNIRNLYNGSFVKQKEVQQFKGQTIEVEAPKQMLIEIDGELLGKGSVSFSLLPAQVRVLTN
jgi:diacylglycerol kinase (ATP)